MNIGKTKIFKILFLSGLFGNFCQEMTCVLIYCTDCKFGETIYVMNSDKNINIYFRPLTYTNLMQPIQSNTNSNLGNSFNCQNNFMTKQFLNICNPKYGWNFWLELCLKPYFNELLIVVKVKYIFMWNFKQAVNNQITNFTKPICKNNHISFIYLNNTFTLLSPYLSYPSPIFINFNTHVRYGLCLFI